LNLSPGRILLIGLAAPNCPGRRSGVSRAGSQHTVEPLASAQKDAKTIVTNRVTGNFPGSPIDLQFIFGLDGNKIASLEIRL
jgi:hypothetical protein